MISESTRERDSKVQDCRQVSISGSHGTFWPMSLMKNKKLKLKDSLETTVLDWIWLVALILQIEDLREINRSRASSLLLFTIKQILDLCPRETIMPVLLKEWLEWTLGEDDVPKFLIQYIIIFTEYSNKLN